MSYSATVQGATFVRNDLFRIFSQLHSADYIYIRVKVDEEKKVDAVRVFYKGVVGNVNAVQILQFISKRFYLPWRRDSYTPSYHS